MKKLMIFSLTCMLTLNAMDNPHTSITTVSSITDEEVFYIHSINPNAFKLSNDANNKFKVGECVEIVRSNGEKQIGVVAPNSDTDFYKVNQFPMKPNLINHNFFKAEQIGKINNFSEISRLIHVNKELKKLYSNSPKSFKINFSKKHTFNAGEHVICKQEKELILVMIKKAVEIKEKSKSKQGFLLSNRYELPTKKIGKITNLNELINTIK